jgi:hypothetical protein
LAEKTGWNFIGGLIEGVNCPKGKYDDKPFVDLNGCKGIIIVSTDYFLKYNNTLKAWALDVEDEIKEFNDYSIP